MAQVQANGISIEYESYGAEDAPAILLIMGLGGQLTVWQKALVDLLVAEGFRVVRFDNRDVGLTTKFDDAGVPDMGALVGALLSGETPQTAYSLDDMAADAARLLEALDIESAHIVGASMGGMIAQLVAINHPEKTLSLTSIMSHTGNKDLPQAKPEAMGVFMRPAPDAEDVETIIANGVDTWKVLGSPGYPSSDEDLRAWVTRDYERSFYPVGVARQLAAIVAAPDRRDALGRLNVPAVVVHGADDPLVPVEGGRDTAASIPAAELRVIEGMAHDFPVALATTFADAILAAAARASAQAAAE